MSILIAKTRYKPHRAILICTPKQLTLKTKFKGVERLLESFKLKECSTKLYFLTFLSGKSLYEADTPQRVQKVTYSVLYNYYAKQSYRFLVTMCEMAGDELVMTGFIYK